MKHKASKELQQLTMLEGEPVGDIRTKNTLFKGRTQKNGLAQYEVLDEKFVAHEWIVTSNKTIPSLAIDLVNGGDLFYFHFKERGISRS
ncbi:hypothetical protein [Methyloglobulus sp.]|uniref:hypothetical protein n=1 Tax=Methyloglobulus sp. TaxID=2518622 RepID=UPI0032B78FAE